MKEEARKTMRVAVYCRLARADQEDTLLEVQKERLRVYAKERGYDMWRKSPGSAAAFP